MKRWRLRCVALDGMVIHERAHRWRRSAVREAESLASPLYDVLVERVDGSSRPMLWPHVPPGELARRLLG